MSANAEELRCARSSRCLYHNPNLGQTSPHSHRDLHAKPKIMGSILECIGHTPLVRLNKVPKLHGIACEMLAKCEFLNPGGSIKDRIAVRMVEEEEEAGRIQPGDTLVESTAGNTGISLALVSAVKGYKCTVVLPDKFSDEKSAIPKILGADVIRTRAVPLHHHGNDHFIAEKLGQENPRWHNLAQFSHPGNALAHYDITAEEILQSCDGQLDMLVAGSGSGGTLTGLSRKIKEVCPNCKIIGVDPVGSVEAGPPEINVNVGCKWLVEGIGQSFKPAILDRTLVDKWYKVEDEPSFRMARRLITTEGLLCGGSSGAAMLGAVMAIRDFGLSQGQRCVVILPDSMRNYMSTFLNDEWMKNKGFPLDDVYKPE